MFPGLMLAFAVFGISLPDGETSTAPSSATLNHRTTPHAITKSTSLPILYTRLRGGVGEYDSTKAQQYDQVLWDILDKHPDEIYFLNTVFNFLQRRTPCFNGENAARNYNILIDTLTRQRDKYLEHVSKGSKMKPHQPMKPTPAGPAARPKAPTSKPSAPKPSPPASKPVPMSMPVDDPDVQEVDLTKREKATDGSQEPIGNGGRTDKYVWTQTLKEVSVEVFLPKGVTARQLQVKFGPQHLFVGVKGHEEPIIDGDLDDGIFPSECYWTVEDDLLSLVLAKTGDMTWWKRVIKGDAKIDVKKIEPENSNLSDLTPDLRQTVEKMMHDQRQKAMGKPTTDESRNSEMMKKFMAQHPEMDFSNCKFPSS